MTNETVREEMKDRGKIMTDSEIIVFLAHEVMGWMALPWECNEAHCGEGSRRDGPCGRGCAARTIGWNPLENIGDAFEVQTRILEGSRSTRYVLQMYDMIAAGNGCRSHARMYRRMLSATARERCLAAVEAMK